MGPVPPQQPGMRAGEADSSEETRVLLFRRREIIGLGGGNNSPLQ